MTSLLSKKISVTYFWATFRKTLATFISTSGHTVPQCGPENVEARLRLTGGGARPSAEAHLAICISTLFTLSYLPTYNRRYVRDSQTWNVTSNKLFSIDVDDDYAAAERRRRNCHQNDSVAGKSLRPKTIPAAVPSYVEDGD